jgi:hypothetical protein
MSPQTRPSLTMTTPTAVATTTVIILKELVIDTTSLLAGVGERNVVRTPPPITCTLVYHGGFRTRLE